MDICFYFQLHQPYRIKEYSIFDINWDQSYFNDALNRDIFLKVAQEGYAPANNFMQKLISKHKKFKCAFSLSGTFLEQSQSYMPDLLSSFAKLLDTDRAELLGETYYHSLAAVFSESEFKEQVSKHKDALRDIFCYTPKSLRNTELLYNDANAHLAGQLGFRTILAEGVINKEYCTCPNYFYNVLDCNRSAVLLRNAKISDAITLDFSEAKKQRSLDPKKVARQIMSEPGEVVNIFLDYELLGNNDSYASGFLETLVDKLEHLGANFILPAEAPLNSDQDYSCPEFSSCADASKDLSAWLSNNMQRTIAKELYELEKKVKICGKPETLEAWRKLQTSDHLYYMFTQPSDDYAAHKFFNPFASPHAMFISLQNILRDFKERLS